jgi:hypothetical protein
MLLTNWYAHCDRGKHRALPLPRSGLVRVLPNSSSWSRTPLRVLRSPACSHVLLLPYVVGSKRPRSIPNLTVSCLPPLSSISEQWSVPISTNHYFHRDQYTLPQSYNTTSESMNVRKLALTFLLLSTNCL